MQFNDSNPALALGWLARAQLCGKGYVGGPEQWAKTHGVPSDALRLIKGAVAGGNTLDSESGSTEYTSATNAFLGSLQTSSIFFRILSDNNFLRCPLRTRIGAATGVPVGFIVGEGRTVPTTRLTLQNSFLTPVTAAALLVLTTELINNVGAASQILFNRLLRDAVAAVVDQRFLAMIQDSDTDVVDSAGDVMTDMRALLSSVNSGSAPSLYFIVAADVAKRASTFPTLFPSMSASGGELCNLPALVSNVVENGTVTLINAAAVAADAGNISIRTSTSADIEMRDDPTMDATSGARASLVSMFQTDSNAIMALVSFGCERLRADAVAVLQGVAWGDEASA